MFATSFLLGYHGFDREVGEAVLSGREHVVLSENVYDWLGHGAYFWENSAKRALDGQLFQRNIRESRVSLYAAACVMDTCDLFP